MEDIKLKSGSLLKITLGSFEDGLRLVESILQQGADRQANMNLADLSAPNVKVALAKCLEVCTYDLQKIDAGLLSDPKVSEKIRADWFEICEAVVAAHVKSFFLNRPSAS